MTPPNDQASLDRLRQLCQKWCGVHLDSSKTYLIQNRLKDILQESNSKSFRDLITAAERPSGIALRDRIVDALTTHETLFFRDRSPFEAIRQHILPQIKQAAGARRPKLRVWSAACSTGQEPYSLMMLLIENAIDPQRWDITIDATDVSPGSIEKAKAGRYEEHELTRGLTSSQRERFFTKKGDTWQIQDSIRRMVHFRVANLLTGQSPGDGYDLILCRNVAIYFTSEDRLKLFEHLSKKLNPQGYLFVGCSEVLTNVGHVLRSESIGRATCYRSVSSKIAPTVSTNPYSSSVSGAVMSSVGMTSGITSSLRR